MSVFPWADELERALRELEALVLRELDASDFAYFILPVRKESRFTMATQGGDRGCFPEDLSPLPAENWRVLTRKRCLPEPFQLITNRNLNTAS